MNLLISIEKNKNVLPLEKKHIDALTYIVEEESEKPMERLINIVKKEIENLPPKMQTNLLIKQRKRTYQY